MPANPTPRDTSSGAGCPSREDIRLARSWLTWAVEPGDLGLHHALAELGPVETARRLRAGATAGPLRGLVGPARTVDRAGEDLRAAAEIGARLVTPEDQELPGGRLEGMRAGVDGGVAGSAPPVGLWVRGTGRLGEVCGRAVAVVGTRAATAYGRRGAGDLAYRLAARGWTVVSGGGYGIDAEAHRGALVAGGRTVAVLGCGLHRPSPSGHGALFDEMGRGGGVVVSEWPVICVGLRSRLVARNRLIAGLVDAVVVVEALPRSATVNTAWWARTYRRPVMAVPGPATSAASAGCHVLLRSGDARLVTNAEEIIELAGPGN